MLGDARLTMAKEANDSFDLIIVDAFSSDAVPVHLMTAEAIRLYLDKVKPDGIVLLHISNRYLDLDSVLGATVKVLPGAHGFIISDDDGRRQLRAVDLDGGRVRQERGGAGAAALAGGA